MSAEIIMAGCAVAGVIMVAVTQVGVIRKNGRDNRDYAEQQAKRDQKLVDSVDGVIRRLDDPKTGMSALNHKINEMQVHCRGVTSGFEERMKNVEKK